MRCIRRLALTLSLGCVLFAAGSVPAGAQHATYAIDNFHADIVVRHDASLLVTETIDVDFAGDQHGIFRTIPVDYAYDAHQRRVYKLTVQSVTDGSGAPQRHTETHDAPDETIRIGDPDHTISGKHTYRLTYIVRGALNAFDDHDEVYWNVTGGQWSVPITRSSATLTVEDGGIEQAQCYEGPGGSTEGCPAGIFGAGHNTLYGAARPLLPGEQLTIVAAVRKGLLAPPPLLLEPVGPRSLRSYFAVTPVMLAIVVIGTVLGTLFSAVYWWRGGRDRVYRTLYYLTHDPREQTRPLLYRDRIVVEYTPPDDLRPAQMGLLLDERTDNKDVAATIVDLAVRGYISITELAPPGFLMSGDWQITRTKKSLDDLNAYERTLLKGILGDRDEVELGSLHTDYPAALYRADEELAHQAAAWFVRDPRVVRSRWRWCGMGALLSAVPVTWIAAAVWDAGLAGIPVAFLGLLFVLTASWMPKRTAGGSELLRRVLGFRLYIDTAEKRRQEFNEKANIFAEYLPYAIVFGCVTKWAHVFRDIDTTNAVSAWYSGPGAFNAAHVSSGLHGFSHAVSAAGFNSLANTPGGHGRSGFGGFGGSGFGGGFGGGGGVW
jgi:uncharacterized membrane protein YgcG